MTKKHGIDPKRMFANLKKQAEEDKKQKEDKKRKIKTEKARDNFDPTRRLN